MKSPKGRFSVEPDELFFHGPRSVPITRIIRIVNLSDRPCTPRVALDNYETEKRATINTFFNIEGGDSAYAWAPQPGEPVAPSAIGEIKLTLNPSPRALDYIVPNAVRVTMDRLDDYVDIKIRYDDHPIVPKTIMCRNCPRAGVYKCPKCTPDFSLCLTCAERGGCDAHVTFYGSSHTPRFESDRVKCIMCHNRINGLLAECLDCSRKDNFLVAFCGICAGDHEILVAHCQGKPNDHILRFTGSHPVALREPDPHVYERENELVCDVCDGRLRNEHEFFRCHDCIKGFVMCDSCADKGGVAAHFLHKLHFSIAIANTVRPEGRRQSLPGGDLPMTPNPEDLR